jgi:predicted Fe-Mo cluster-binding NifX family protein
MRIAISVDDSNGLGSVVSPHFGRCPYYAFVDVRGCEVTQVNVLENPFYGHHQPGQVPGFIERQGAHVMLTGGMGRRAISFFEQSGIEAVTGAGGTVQHALEQYLGGTLLGAAPCRESIAHTHEELPGEGEYEQDEAGETPVGRLREEVQMLQEQLADVSERLKRLAADQR